MRVSDALERLDDIHEQLTKAEVYRGFRGSGVALAGAVGLLAAAAQPLVPAAAGPVGFVAYWGAVAVLGAGLGGGAALHAYLFREDEFARRRTRRVQAQFLPCLAAGAVLTLALTRSGPELVPFLPGAWALLFGLGIVSARPYLPRATGWVALFYLAAGSWLLARPGPAEELSGWSVGGVFGPGHLLTAAVLWRNRARESDG
jgi:hypothetical protein